MTIKTHRLKIEYYYYVDILKGKKTFEVRKFDRDYEVMDYLVFDVILEHEIKHFLTEFQITYILDHDDFPDGIKEGYCVLGIKEVKQ